MTSTATTIKEAFYMADATFDAIKIGIASPEMIRSWSFGIMQDKAVSFLIFKRSMEKV